MQNHKTANDCETPHEGTSSYCIFIVVQDLHSLNSKQGPDQSFFDQGNRRVVLYGNFLLMIEKQFTRKEACGIYMSGGEEGRSYTRKAKFKKDQSTQIRLLCVWV
jgi:hypothetical protein